MKSAIVMQARNSSTRYPQKMLHRFMGKTAIEWVMDRCARADVDLRILATSVEHDDDVLETIAKKKGWHVVRGSLNDVLSRYAKAVREHQLDIVVRITGDCILTDYRLINTAIKKLIAEKLDYVGLAHVIDGFDVEVIKAKAIIQADKCAHLPSEREHVTPYVNKNPDKFKISALPYGAENLSHIHLSLDYREDALSIGMIVEELRNTDFSYEDVVALIKQKPHILEHVKNIIPNEGYRKSLKEDEEMIGSSGDDSTNGH
jgi:spore coat polysaccharide biosynthesis protein SpsF (cytidylyltransferase family)